MGYIVMFTGEIEFLRIKIECKKSWLEIGRNDFTIVLFIRRWHMTGIRRLMNNKIDCITNKVETY